MAIELLLMYNNQKELVITVKTMKGVANIFQIQCRISSVQIFACFLPTMFTNCYGQWDVWTKVF